MERITAALRVLLDHHDEIDIAVEPTAGAPGCVASSMEQLAELLDALDHHPRLRFCPDTCHLWAAGTDYSDDAVVRRLRGELAEIGPERFVAVHLNDSKDPCGAKRDRHANLGTGLIPVEAIRRLVTCDELAAAPLIVETPRNARAHDQKASEAARGRHPDVVIARSWIGSAPTRPAPAEGQSIPGLPAGVIST